MKLYNMLQSNPTLLMVSIIIMLCLCILVMFFLILCKFENEKSNTISAIELNKITNSIHAGLVQFIPRDTCTIHYASEGFYNLLGYSEKEAMKKNKYSIMDFVYPKDKDYFITSVYNVEEGSINFEVRLVKKDGTIIYCLINGNHVMAKNGNYTISAVFVDITRQKKMQEMLRMDRERYRVASELSNDVLFEYYVINDEMIFSDKFKELFGRDTIMDNFVRDCYLRRDMVHPDDYGLYLDFCTKLSEGKEYVTTEFRLKHRPNDYIWCQIMGKTIYDEDDLPNRVIGKIVNVDYQKRELNALEYKATRDPLTGVYNKEVTFKKIDRYISGNKNGRHALMLIDFDDFKHINDNYGHLVGDKVLTYVVRRIREVFAEGEIIGRIGGDEFVVFIGYVGDHGDIVGKASILGNALYTTYVDGNCEIQISGSIGIATYPDNGMNYEQLVQCADQALYCVKSQGKNSFMLYGVVT